MQGLCKAYTGEPTHLTFVRDASVSKYTSNRHCGNLSGEALGCLGAQYIVCIWGGVRTGEPPADSNAYSDFKEAAPFEDAHGLHGACLSA